MSRQRPLRSITDDDLLSSLADLVRQSRRVEAPLVAHIAEVEARRLYARFACTSMFKYCTDVLHLSESEAYYRIAVARATLEHPVLLEMLTDGRLHLSGIASLASHLTPENRDAVLARAAHKSKREIEELIAELAPRPDVPSVMRKLPQGSVVAGRCEEDPRHLLELAPDESAPPREAVSEDGSTQRSEVVPGEVTCLVRISSVPTKVWRPRRPDALRRRLPPFSRCRPRGTRSSSRPAPRSTTSSSVFGPSSVRRCRTATSVSS